MFWSRRARRWDAIRQIGVSEVTYYRWRQEFGGLKTEHEIDPKRTSQNWSRRNASARIVLSFAKLLASLSSTVKAMEVPSHGDETILMVEDDELVRMSVQSLIESLGYRVVPARDGLDALEILRHDTP